MSGRVLEARLDAQRRLTSSFDPAESRRGGMSFDEACDAGGKAIYGIVTRNADPDVLDRKWSAAAKAKTHEAHRDEAAACLRAAGWRP